MHKGASFCNYVHVYLSLVYLVTFLRHWNAWSACPWMECLVWPIHVIYVDSLVLMSTTLVLKTSKRVSLQTPPNPMLIQPQNNTGDPVSGCVLLNWNHISRRGKSRGHPLYWLHPMSSTFHNVTVIGNTPKMWNKEERKIWLPVQTFQLSEHVLSVQYLTTDVVKLASPRWCLNFIE